MIKKINDIKFQKRESSFISTLLMVGIFVVITNYLLIPKYNLLKEKQGDLENLKQIYEARKLDYSQKAIYEDQIIKFNEEYKNIVQMIPSYIEQEDIILTIDELSKKNSIIIENINFDNINAVELKSFISGELKDSESSNKDDNKSDTAKNKENVTVPTVLSKGITVSFYGDISAIYNLLDGIELNTKKVCVKEITISKEKDKGNLLKTTLKIQYVAYKDSSTKEEYKIEIPKIDGKENPFNYLNK